MFTPEEIERFKSDPEYFQKFRRTMESLVNVSRVFALINAPLIPLHQSMHSYTQRGSQLSADLQAAFREKMVTQLAKRPWIAEKRPFFCGWAFVHELANTLRRSHSDVPGLMQTVDAWAWVLRCTLC